jgi:hypothetical protein
MPCKGIGEELPPLLLDLIEGSALVSGIKMGKVTIHHEPRKPDLLYVGWQWGIDRSPAGNQSYLMPFQGLADLQAPEIVPDSQEMLAVLQDSHINKRSRRYASGLYIKETIRLCARGAQVRQLDKSGVGSMEVSFFAACPIPGGLSVPRKSGY